MLVLDFVICCFVFLVVLLVLCGFQSLVDRRVSGVLQLRVGPCFGFVIGLLVPVFDGVKLVCKSCLFMCFGYVVFGFVGVVVL